MTQRLIVILLSITCLIFAQNTLREAASKRSLYVGTSAQVGELGKGNRLKDANYSRVLSTQYSMLEAENVMRWSSVRYSKDSFNFGEGDEIVAFAKNNSMKVRAQNLLWNLFNPSWLDDYAKTASTSDMSNLAQDYITNVVTHWKGSIYAWDVVDEAVDDSTPSTSTKLKDSIWYNKPGIGLGTGTQYIEQAFQWAHAADPDALLFYNDYNIEGPNDKFAATLLMLQDFVTRKVPIHGLGFQFHIDLNNWSLEQIEGNFKKVIALGLQIHISEMDVRLPNNVTPTQNAANLQAQAKLYSDVLSLCLKYPECTAFQTWGFTDLYSWIPDNFNGYGQGTPLDENYNPKPAFDAMLATLKNYTVSTTGQSAVTSTSTSSTTSAKTGTSTSSSTSSAITSSNSSITRGGTSESSVSSTSSSNQVSTSSNLVPSVLISLLTLLLASTR